MDIESIRTNYAKMDDLKLERVITQDILSLEPEVLPILVEEVKRRDFDDAILSHLQEQIALRSPEVQLALINRVKSLVCPICKEPHKVLIGGRITIVWSAVFFTSFRKKMIIACKDCVNDKKNKQLVWNLIFGWWGFPWGIIRTLQALINHISRNSTKEQALSEEILGAYSMGHVSLIRQYWENDTELVHLTDEFNKSQ